MTAAQVREERLRMALEQVQMVLWKMSTAEDLHEVLKVIYEELQVLLPVVNACSIQIVDVEGKTAMSYQISEQKVYEYPIIDFAGTAVEVAWREQRVVSRPDLTADDPYGEAWLLQTEDLYGLQVRAVVDVPFRQGTLAVNSTQPHAFPAEAIEILRETARGLERHCVPMIHAELRHEQVEIVNANIVLQRDNCLLVVFHDIARLMLTSPDLDRALDIMVEHITRANIFHRLLIALVDAQARMVSVVRDAGHLRRDQSIVGYACSLDGQSMLAEVARTGEMRVVVGLEGRVDGWLGSPEDDAHRVFYFVPIQGSERVVMVVVVDSTLDEQEEVLHDFRMLRPLLSQVLVNIEYAHLYQEARAHTLELTQINEALQREIAEHRRAEEARIAAERELEEQRVLRMRSDRLRSLGEMATGIAHELNQPLVGVRGLAEHMLLAMKRGWPLTTERMRDNLGLIVDQADRMAYIIDHVRMFSKGAGNPEVSSVQVNEVVRSAVGMLGTQFRARGIELTCEVEEALPPVSANPFSLEEVVLNLMINARDAVEDGLQESVGRTTPRVLLRTSDDQDDPERRVKIEVIDWGIGIPEHVLPRIFDPFFTTKDLTKGTGLGLSISRTIVEQYGGTISVHSTPGHGTTFTVALPGEELPGGAL